MDAAILTNTAEAANAKPMFVTYSYGSGSATDVNKVLSADDGVLKTWNPSSGQLAIAYEGSDQPCVLGCLHARWSSLAMVAAVCTDTVHTVACQRLPCKRRDEERQPEGLQADGELMIEDNETDKRRLIVWLSKVTMLLYEVN